jgi:nucleoside-diphosphate-sugar epimerase
MEKILCTGGSGFIASNLIPRLVEKGYCVHALERYVTGRYDLGPNRNPRIIDGDLNDHDKIREIIVDLKPDYVVHLAAITPVAYSYEHPFEVIQTNFTATVNLLEINRKYNPHLKQFLYAGSSEEYGIQDDFPIKESAELRPNNPYSTSKVASDCYLRYMRDAYGFPMTILRPFNTYGRTKNMFMVVERIISQMLKSKTVNLGDSSPIRDFVYVDDHVDAYLTCLGNEKALGETFNFCTGVGVSIRELVEEISSLMGYEGEIVWEAIPPRPLDIKVLIGDNSKAKGMLGWSPKVDLENGLKRTIDKMRDKNGLQRLLVRKN